MKDQSVYELNKTQRYIMQMRLVLHKRALFCDGTADYRKPIEPKANEMVEIRFGRRKTMWTQCFCGRMAKSIRCRK